MLRSPATDVDLATDSAGRSLASSNGCIPTVQATQRVESGVLGVGGVRIIEGDSLIHLPLLASESVNLIVTSPPYYNAKEYARWDSYAEYLAWCEIWIRECLRVLENGRMLCINTSPVIVARVSRSERSQRHNIPADLHGICRALGAWFAEDITWEKPEGAAINRNQRFSLDRHPMQWRANGTTERVMVYQKPTLRLNDDIVAAHDTRHRLLGEYERGEVWRMNPEQTSEHPAAFPLALPSRLIRYYTWPGETVLDPFAGSGTTLLAARDADCKAIGIERSHEYCALIRGRLAQSVLPLGGGGAEHLKTSPAEKEYNV